MTTQKYKIGEKVLYRNRVKTINEVRTHGEKTLYLLKELSGAFFEEQLKPYAEITKSK